MKNKKYEFLDRVNVPADLRGFSVQELKGLCADVREYLIHVVSQTGGHLGAGLGSVELAVACHYVFNTPDDKLVWDVGHQAYPHKILTGRKEFLSSIRQYHGLSGFLKRSESEYDVFGAGHASTAISASLGMVAARELTGERYHVVSVVGDGAMTGGMAYEGMNNAGMMKKDLIVILNDNNMSIAPNVWAISDYFTQLISNPSYNKFKSHVYQLTGKLDTFGDRIRGVAARVEEGIKVIITPGMLFEALGFRYFGPVNGHNIAKLVHLLRDVKNYPGPILVHVITQKGKGYKPAEDHVQRLHGVTPFDKVTGLATARKTQGPPAYTTVFGKAMVELAKQDERIVGITAAMPDGTGLDHLQKELPSRFYDVGIAEQHGVTFAAGLATQGCKPVVAVYSTFLQRAFDQIIHDVALQHLPVVFVLDRAGLVGADGPTHHGIFDLSYLRLIPGMIIMAPSDESELRDMLYTALQQKDGPVAVRYPRGNGVGVPLKAGFSEVPIGMGQIVREGHDVAVLTVGPLLHNALKAAGELEKQRISAEIVNMRFVKPLDASLLDALSSRFSTIVTIEDNTISGGFGSAVNEYFSQRQQRPAVYRHGISDRFVDHGTPDELYKEVGLDPEGIARFIRTALGENRTPEEKMVQALPV
jgi:1-deoxy-D-xylulose-5-phosphate synthase